MSDATQAPELTPDKSRAAWIKSVLLGLLIFALLAALVLPAVWTKSGVDSVRDANTVGVTIQLILTAVCVGGWFGAFLFFNQYLGDPEH